MKRWMLIGLSAMMLAGQVAMAKTPADSKIVIAADWNKNRKMEYQYTSVTKNYENQDLKKEKVSKGLAVHRRVRKEKASYVFELQYLNNETNDPIFKLPAYKQWLDEANQQKIIYRVGKQGGFMGIQNLEDLQKISEKMVELICAQAKDEQTQQLKESLQETMTSRDFIENTYTEEVKILYGMYGLELKPDLPIEFESELPSLLDGSVAYPAKFAVALKEYDSASGLCKVEIKVDPFPEEFAKINAESLKKLTGKEVDPQLMKQMNLSIAYSFSYDTKRKIITKLYYIKDTTNLQARTTVETTMELVSK